MSFAAILAVASAAVVQPVGDSRSWITADDYPRSALRAGTEGDVRVILSIDTSGHVAGCTINRSSGNAELDALTCKLLRERAQFFPARDASGLAAPSQFVQTVRWSLPRDKLISRGFRMTYSLDASGGITGCKIDEFGDHDPDLTCSSQNVEKVAPSFLKNPLTHYRAISFLMAMEIDDDTTINILRSEGEERSIIAQARIRVSSAGVITDCVATKIAEYDSRSFDICIGYARVGQKEFEPDSGGHERVLTVGFELAGTPR